MGLDGLAEDARPVTVATAYRAALRALGDVLALGEDGAGERHDLLDAGLRRLGDRLRRLAGADAGLDVARPQDALHGDLQLTES